MALILQIETATISCSAALVLDGKVLAVRERHERNIHASHITLFIQEVMDETGKSMKDIDAVAVSMGPGSYTGLRIGVSTAKGLCYALDIPLIAINTLKAMASAMVNSGGDGENFLYCPMIDARRMEVYAAVFNRDLDDVNPVQAKIIDQDSFADLLATHKIVFFGDGASKCRDILDHANAIIRADFLNSSKDMSGLAFDKFKKQEFEDVAYFEPFYLKDFISINFKGGNA